MSMMSSLSDGNDTLQPPERNPHGFTLSGGDIPDDKFFFEPMPSTHSGQSSATGGPLAMELDDSDQEDVNPGRKCPRRLVKRSDEDKLVGALKFDIINTKDGVDALFSTLVAKAVASASNGPHMAIENVLPEYINGYSAIMGNGAKIGMHGHGAQYEIIKRVFLGDGPLAGHEGGGRLPSRMVGFFRLLDEVATNVFELTRDLSRGWDMELKPKSVGQSNSNLFVVNIDDFPNSKFEHWMPTQRVFIAEVLECGGDVSAYRNQVLRAASKATVQVDDALLREMSKIRSLQVKGGRVSGSSKSSSSESRDQRRAYPVIGCVDFATFAENARLFESCSESVKGRYELNEEEKHNVDRLLSGKVRQDRTAATIADLATQFDFDHKLRCTVKQFGELVKSFKEGGEYLISEGMYREGVFILTSLQNNQSVHVPSNNKVTTWALKLLHEVLRLHDPRLKDKQFERTQEKPEPSALRSCKRQRTHCESADVPHQRASVMIIYLIAERMSCLYRIRHRAFESSGLITDGWDISHAKCDAHIVNPNAERCRSGMCTARKSEELKRLLGIHKSDVTSVAEYFQGARTTSKASTTPSNDSSVAIRETKTDEIAHGSVQAMRRLDEACTAIERIVNGITGDDDCVEDLFGSDDDDDDDDDAGAVEAAQNCTTIQIFGGGEPEQEVDQDDEEEDSEQTLSWLRPDKRMKHGMLLDHIRHHSEAVRRAITFAEDCIELQTRVAKETQENVDKLNSGVMSSSCTELEMKTTAFNAACNTVARAMGEYNNSDLKTIVGAPERWKWNQDDRVTRLAALRRAKDELQTYERIVREHSQRSEDLRSTGFFNFFDKVGSCLESLCALKAKPQQPDTSDPVYLDFDMRSKDPCTVSIDWLSTRLAMYQSQSEEFSATILQAVRNAFLFCCHAVKIQREDSLSLPDKYLEFNGIGISCILTMLSISHRLGFVKMLGPDGCLTRDFTESNERFVFCIHDTAAVLDRRISVASVDKLRRVAMSAEGWKLVCMLTEVAHFVACVSRKREYNSRTTFKGIQGNNTWLTLSSGVPFAKIHDARELAFSNTFNDIQELVNSSYPSRYAWSFADACELRKREQIKTISVWVPAFLNNRSGFIDIKGARNRPSKREDAHVDPKRCDEIDALPRQYFEQFYKHAQFGDVASDETLDSSHSPDASLPGTCYC